MFIQDDGSPLGFRIAVRHPDWIQTIVLQNGNAYEEGFTGVWDAFRTALWNRTRETEASLANFFTLQGVMWMYREGTWNRPKISPNNWNIDLLFLGRLENHRIQVDLFYDYRTNVNRYPRWHGYLREHQPSTRLVWGANDPVFTQDGGRAFLRDIKDAEIMLDTGHFALEGHCEGITAFVRSFYDRKVAGMSV